MPKSKPQPPLTKKRFESLLTKAAQPVSEWNKPSQEGKETKAENRADGYTETRKNPDTLEGKEG